MWDKVYEGESVRHSARRENAISDILNQFPAINGQTARGFYGQNVTLTGFALVKIPAGAPVSIGRANADQVCEVTPEPKADDFWGISSDMLAPTMTGVIIVQGITVANILLNNVEHCFAKLKEGVLISCEEKTSCRILSTPEETGQKLCTVFLGEQQSTASEILTDFAVTLEEDNTLSISGGYLNRNGTLLKVEGKKQIAPQSGTLCLRSVLEEKAEGSQWTAPEFVFCEIACNAWPVAEVTVIENEDTTKKISVRQRITNVAMILQTKPCPLTTVGALKK